MMYPGEHSGGFKFRVVPDTFDPAVIEDRRLRIMVHLALGTGMRRFEILNLRIPDLLEPGGEVHQSIRIVGKRKRVGEIRFSPAMRGLLKDYITELCRPGQEWLLASDRMDYGQDPPQPKRMSIRMINYSWDQFKRKAGPAVIDPKTRFHDLRHTFATRALKASNNLKLVQILMRHSNLNVTALYLHPSEDDIQATVDAIGG